MSCFLLLKKVFSEEIIIIDCRNLTVSSGTVSSGIDQLFKKYDQIRGIVYGWQRRPPHQEEIEQVEEFMNQARNLAGNLESNEKRQLIDTKLRQLAKSIQQKLKEYSLSEVFRWTITEAFSLELSPWGMHQTLDRLEKLRNASAQPEWGGTKSNREDSCGLNIPLVPHTPKSRPPLNTNTTFFSPEPTLPASPCETPTFYPTSIQHRRFPPLGPLDTIIGIRIATAFGTQNKVVSTHGRCNVYRDDEILTLHPSVQEIDLSDRIEANITDNGKVVIQQQATRGCTAAAAAMLIYDAGKPVNTKCLAYTDLGNTQSIKSLIASAGLTSRVTTLNTNKIKGDQLVFRLKQLICEDGSAIVSIDGDDFGSHCIVVDEISEDLSSVRLRDPYHGWAITVTKEAFLRNFEEDSLENDIIQITVSLHSNSQ